MVHLKDLLKTSKLMKVEFRVTPKSRILSVRLWEGGRLVDLDFLSRDRGAAIVKNLLSNNSQFLSLVSQNPENISCGLVGVEVMTTLIGYSAKKL